MPYTRFAHALPDASEPYVGEIQMIGTNFAPMGWQFCDGSILSIADNSVLFDLIGTTYGGDGQTTFAVPDLRGRVPIHWGTNSNGVTYVIGETGGATTTTMAIDNLPAHQHVLSGQVALLAKGDNPGNNAVPGGNYVPSIAPGKTYYAPAALGAGQLTGPLSVDMTLGVTGGGTAVSTMQPFVAVYFIISLFGVFPSQ